MTSIAAPLVVLPPIALGDPAQLDLTAYRGDTGRFRVTITEDGAPLDVSAATWDCDIRASSDGALMASMTVTPVVGTTNAVDVTLPASATVTLSSFTEGVWDLEMTLGVDPDTTVTTILRGAFTLVADVSRAPFAPPPTEGAVSSFAAPAALLGDQPEPMAPLIAQGWGEVVPATFEESAHDFGDAS